MASEDGGVEFYIDADARGVLAAGEAVHKTSADMLSDFGKVDKATTDLITSQISLGNTITKTGKVIDAQGKEVKGATNAMSQLIAKQNSLRDQSLKVQAVQDGLNKTYSKASKGAAAFGRSSGQAGIQLQQFIGQIQGGQSPMLAFSQQSADLGIVLGAPLLGAVAGISSSLVGLLIPSLMDTGQSAAELKKDLEELAKTELLTAEQAIYLADVESDSAIQIEKKIKALKKDIAENERATKRYKDHTAAIEGDVVAEARWIDETIRLSNASKDAAKELLEQKANLSLLSTNLDKANKKIQQYNMGISEGTELTGKQKESIQSVIKSVQEQASALGKSERQIALATEGLNEGQKKAINTAFDLIDANKARMVSDKAIVAAQAKEKAIYDSVTASLNNKIAALQPLAIAQDEYNVRARLGLSQDEAITDEIQAQIDKIAELTKAKENARVKQQEDRKVVTEFESLRTGLDRNDTSELDRLNEELNSKRDLTNEYYALQLEDLSLNDEQLAVLAQKREDTLSDIERAGAKSREEIAEKEKRARLNTASQIFSNLSSLMNTESRKLFEIGKVAAISGAVVDGLSAAVTNYKQGSKIGGPPVGAAFAAASLVATGSQIQQIKSQQFGGGGSSSTSFSDGVPTTNTSSSNSSSQQNISISGIDANSLVSGSQLVNTLNEALGDGYTINFAGS